ncbi:MAG: NTP transferase domain-containing protein [Alphaproteobacteria bacterium]|nr:NTP transferase domain-containing protein [Alphaproteobacteria bacterium]
MSPHEGRRKKLACGAPDWDRRVNAPPATVCILAAGAGSRSRAHELGMHKALLPVGNRAVLTHQIEQFPPGTRFVIALGHYADQVRDYMALAHPEIDAVFVGVDRVTGPTAGPGYSLLCCRSHLRRPFIFTACDTLIPGELNLPEGNWVGVHHIDQPERWCTVAVDADGMVDGVIYKKPEGSSLGFIGIAGVADHEPFWQALERGLNERGESQVNPGLEALIGSGLRPVALPWLDSGDDEGYGALLRRFEPNFSFTGKTTDVTYKIGDRIIKFFSDAELTRRRFLRGRRHDGIFATVLDHCGHLFGYRFVPGRPLADSLDRNGVTDLLEWLEASLWRPVSCDRAAFDALCRRFYRDKTLDRLRAYLRRGGQTSEEPASRIDGVTCPTVIETIERLPDAFWTEGLPSTFHGDLHADNVIVGEDGRFTLIDWRHDFGDEMDHGDRYYDLAKFYHTLDFSVAAMTNGFRMDRDGRNVRLAHDQIDDADGLRAAFWAFCARRGYDRSRILVLNALIFVNMAPLYDRPLADYLYHLGRLRLAEALSEGSPSP